MWEQTADRREGRARGARESTRQRQEQLEGREQRKWMRMTGLSLSEESVGERVAKFWAQSAIVVYIIRYYYYNFLL